MSPDADTPQHSALQTWAFIPQVMEWASNRPILQDSNITMTSPSLGWCCKWTKMFQPIKDFSPTSPFHFNPLGLQFPKTFLPCIWDLSASSRAKFHMSVSCWHRGRSRRRLLWPQPVQRSCTRSLKLSLLWAICLPVVAIPKLSQRGRKSKIVF